MENTPLAPICNRCVNNQIFDTPIANRREQDIINRL